MNAADGKVVTSLPIGAGVDAAQFDAEDKLIFISTGEGTLNVYREKSADEYENAGEVATQPSAKTMAFDPKTKKVFLPAAQVEMTPSADPAGKPHRTIKDGTFGVLVVGK